MGESNKLAGEAGIIRGVKRVCTSVEGDKVTYIDGRGGRERAGDLVRYIDGRGL